MVAELPGSQGVYHLVVVRVSDRDRVRRQLADRGIGTGVHYPTPCHRLAPYASLSSAEARGGGGGRGARSCRCRSTRAWVDGAWTGSPPRSTGSSRGGRSRERRDPDVELSTHRVDEGVTLGYPPTRPVRDASPSGPARRLRSGTVLYDGTQHRRAVRDRSPRRRPRGLRHRRSDVSVWTSSVVDYGCRIGDGVKIHTNCYVAQYTEIGAVPSSRRA